MKPFSIARVLCILGLMMLPCIPTSTAIAADEAAPPRVSDIVDDFELKTLADKTVTLSKLAKDRSVVVVVLRGWPGYQCPLCTKQVQQFVQKADEFRAAKAEVVLIYPGPADGLIEHAKEFATDRGFPEGFHFVLDPDYTFTKAWHLRWDAPNETAYPSTFVVGRDMKVRFAKVSKSHGGRANVQDVLKALSAK
jgi:peroxiredoxin Q/BCP